MVLVLATGDLVASFGFSLFFPFLTIYLVQTLGASAAEAGLVIAAYSLCSIVSGIVGGWLADRIGRRPVLIGSVACSAVLVSSMAFVSQAWQIGVVMLLLGCIDPAFVPAARAAVADTVEEERRPRAFGLLAVANAVGWIAGPVIGAGLSTLGYPLLFAVSGLLIGAYVVIAGRWLPETRPARSGTTAVPVTDGPIARAGPSNEAIDPARLRVFIAFLPLLGLSQALGFLWVTTLPIYAAGALGLPIPLWGLLFGLNGLLIVVFQMRVSRAFEGRSKPRLIALSLVLYMAGLGLVAFLSSVVAVAGLATTIVLVTLGELILMPIVPAFVSDLAPAHRRGAFQGLALAASGLGSGLGPPIAGYILDTGRATGLWLGCAAILGLVALAFLGLARWTDGLAASPMGPTRRAADLATGAGP
ncbi:MAG: MFS transporter [Candidatus Limnocylindrales bacterium]